MTHTGRVHDRDLLDALESLDAEPYSGPAWRTAWVTRDPLVGSTAGGRWHPPNSFEALYTSLEADGSLAEVYHHLSRAPVFSSAHVRLVRLNVETVNTLRLTETEVLDRLGIKDSKYRSMDFARSQEIGAAARLLEFDGLLVPSARWACLNLVLFPDLLDPDKALSVDEVSDVNWPAWREANLAAEFQAKPTNRNP
ncbi:MAG: RES family NAD+ phosphorylase [Kiloniellales bacterium]|nr:RES family NAD+ phosphorylase [Kiloniellales bacterium]